MWSPCTCNSLTHSPTRACMCVSHALTLRVCGERVRLRGERERVLWRRVRHEPACVRCGPAPCVATGALARTQPLFSACQRTRSHTRACQRTRSHTRACQRTRSRTHACHRACSHTRVPTPAPTHTRVLPRSSRTPPTSFAPNFQPPRARPPPPPLPRPPLTPLVPSGLVCAHSYRVRHHHLLHLPYGCVVYGGGADR